MSAAQKNIGDAGDIGVLGISALFESSGKEGKPTADNYCDFYDEACNFLKSNFEVTINTNKEKAEDIDAKTGDVPGNNPGQEKPGEQPDQLEEEQKDESQPGQPDTAESPVSSDYISAMLYLINAARNENGLPPLSLNSSLCSISESRSTDMIERDYFSHTTPEGKSIFNILQENGIGYGAAGENIQHTFPAGNASAESFFNTWMNSTGHRENILSGNFSQIGIGFSSNGEWFVSTLVFLG